MIFARTFFALLAVLSLAPSAVAQPGTNVVVAFTTTNATPLNSGFAGFCTEMVYDVQAATNLPATAWPTLGKVAGTKTNFNFTDPVPEKTRFYRLAVP